MNGSISRQHIRSSLRGPRACWLADMMPGAARGRDPLLHELRDGGPFDVHGRLADYLTRPWETDRGHLAAALIARYGTP